MNNTGLLSRLFWGINWRIAAVYRATTPILLPQWDEEECSAPNNGTAANRRAIETDFRRMLSVRAKDDITNNAIDNFTARCHDLTL